MAGLKTYPTVGPNVVLNNGGYKQIGDRLAWFFGHREMCSFSDDLSRVGAAFGIHGERVERLSELAPAMQRALASPTAWPRCSRTSRASPCTRSTMGPASFHSLPGCDLNSM